MSPSSKATRGKKKSLGNLTADQLRRTLEVADQLPTLQNLNILLASRPKFRRAVVESGTVFQWAWAYELSMAELVGLMAWAIDAQDEVVTIIESDDPQETMLRFAERDEEVVVPVEVPVWRKLLVLELLVACIKCFECYRSYSVSLCELVAKARTGNSEAILQAVRVDPTALATPSIAERLSLAVLQGEKRLLKRVKGAFATPRLKLVMYTDLRFVEVLLHEAGAIKPENYDHIYDVIVNRLGLYDHRGEDARKGLLTLFKRWREAAST